ncbi:MAG: membrane protein insertase YidC [Rhizobiales bacterium]|nr:membrane protein insertase YidC [Hyphomicrobiales bacterium]
MENKNLILVLVLSFGFLFGWQYLVQGPKDAAEQARTAEIAKQVSVGKTSGTSSAPTSNSTDTNIPQSSSTGTAPTTEITTNALSISDEFSKKLRIEIASKRIKGSLSLKGGRVDDISLIDYTISLEDDTNVTIFSPSGSKAPYYADFGWAPIGSIKVPDANSLWAVKSGRKLTEATPVTLTWDNEAGLSFIREFSIDENFLISIKQTVKNSSGNNVSLHPYGLISRHGLPNTTGIYILHEGPVGVLGDEGLQEIGYSDLSDDGTQAFTVTKGWLGFTDKYFAATLIPTQGEEYTARFSASGIQKTNFQTDYLLIAHDVVAGGETTVTNHLFVGAKEDSVITAYRDVNGFEKFDLLIDWGIFYFITKPLFWLLNIFNGYIGNFGFAILAVTVVVKALFYPLASKSYASMGKMKKLQPEIAKLKERFADDRVRLQQAQMELFKKEKVNPLAGCWPMLVQIPVFFALYKVLYIAIEMRQAPFFGWIQDLSAPDPTSVFNLFGLIPLSLPEFLLIGVWPILMGITQFIQMRLNPAPTDKVQAMVFGWMPVFFTFLLASFPAGMVIYWTWSNFLGILQQAYIMKKNNVEIALWDNIVGIFKGKTAEETK